jgi:hypothetical protein
MDIGSGEVNDGMAQELGEQYPTNEKDAEENKRVLSPRRANSGGRCGRGEVRRQRYGERRRDHETENVRQAPQETGPEAKEPQNDHNGDHGGVEGVHVVSLGIVG